MSQPKNSATPSQHWVDAICKDILLWQNKNNVSQLHIDDMKTPSGRVHTGALRGVLLHDFIAKALNKTVETVKSTYVFNDMDPMDGLPTYLDPTIYQEHMGKPLCHIPAPSLEHSGIEFSKLSEKQKKEYREAKSFAEFYALDFIEAFRELACSQTIVWSHELYESGLMNDAIKTALDNTDIIRKIYIEIADYKLPKQWYPFQVICEKCGKVGTTLTTDWDGEVVSYICETNKVEWAKGCGYSGKTSPFNGSGKLLWKVDWPAHWHTMGVTVEGAGKDHTSAGGSRDMANALCEKLFKIPTPFDIPYEWILIRGAKMSSSKGVGTSAREFIKIFPPEIGRFLFANSHYNSVIDFDPNSMAIPDLFDAYDQSARIFWQQEAGDQRMARSFEFSQTKEIPQPCFLPRFRDVALWMQHPEIDLLKQFSEIKSAPLTQDEISILESRKEYAQIWVENYAPSEYQLTPKSDLPPESVQITREQRDFFSETVALLASKNNWEPADLQQAIFDLAKASIGPRPGFQAIYLALLGKKSGPRAAWLLLNTPKAVLTKRVQQLESLAENTDQAHEKYLYSSLTNPSLFTISSEVTDTFPSITVGIAVIKGVTINSDNESLRAEINTFLQSVRDLPVREINQFPEIVSYHQLYKETGVDWRSKKPSPEALLRRAAKGHQFQPINTCVDAYNLIVMKNRVSAGAFDLDQLTFPTRLDFSKGTEKAVFIGDQEPTELQKGELCYFDQLGPYNLDFNYRDSVRTQVTNTTKNLLINVEGVFDISRTQVEKSLQEVVAIIQKYCGGTVEEIGIVEAKEE